MKKQTILRLFFTGEVLVFTWFYFCGTNGIFAVSQLKKESILIEEQIQTAVHEIEKLEATIVAWQSDPFYKERIARKDLHMAGKDEKVFICNN